jgi:hypothetical protein
VLETSRGAARSAQAVPPQRWSRRRGVVERLRRTGGGRARRRLHRPAERVGHPRECRRARPVSLYATAIADAQSFSRHPPDGLGRDGIVYTVYVTPKPTPTPTVSAAAILVERRGRRRSSLPTRHRAGDRVRDGAGARLGRREFACLVALWNKESGWR